jgi:phage shock protein E
MKTLLSIALLSGLLYGGSGTIANAQSGKTVSASSSRPTREDVDAKQAASVLQTQKNVVVLDVRTPDEYKNGHVKDAVNLNLYDPNFKSKLAQLDKSKTYVVHCAAGLANGRSRKATAAMDSLGFQHTVHLNGGFNAWQQASLPVVK